MDARNLQQLVEKAKNDILREVNDRLPRKVGITAVNHFRQNFRDAGFRDGASDHGSAHVGRTPILPMPSTRRSPPDATTSCDPSSSRRSQGRSSSPTQSPMRPSTTTGATSLRTHLSRQSFVSTHGIRSTHSPHPRASSPRSYLQRLPSGRLSLSRRRLSSPSTLTSRSDSS